jgi:hypothetical protein
MMIIETPFPRLTPALVETCRKHGLKIIACAQENTEEEYRRIIQEAKEILDRYEENLKE